MPTSVMPASRIASSAWNRIGVPAIGISCFACVWVMRAQPGALAAGQHQRAHQASRSGQADSARARARCRRVRRLVARPSRRPRPASPAARRPALDELQAGEVLRDDLGLASVSGLVRDHRALHVRAVRRRRRRRPARCRTRPRTSTCVDLRAVPPESWSTTGTAMFASDGARPPGRRRRPAAASLPDRREDLVRRRDPCAPRTARRLVPLRLAGHRAELGGAGRDAPAAARPGNEVGEREIRRRVAGCRATA